MWRFEVGWDDGRGAPTRAHLPTLAAKVEGALKSSIERELRHPIEPAGRTEATSRIAVHEGLDDEGRTHREFADERIRFFVGREDHLRRIGEYIDASDPYPLVVHGGGGTGKSALLAQAVARVPEHSNVQLVYRFIGATPGSADGRKLLEGICRELARRYAADESAVPSDYQELVGDFRERLALASAEQPLCLVLDSLDQLSPDSGARRLAWIPPAFPGTSAWSSRPAPARRWSHFAAGLRRRGKRASWSRSARWAPRLATSCSVYG